MTAGSLVLVVGLATGLASCGGDQASERPEEQPSAMTSKPADETAAVCDSLERLKDSVRDLQSIRIEQGTLPVLSAELRDIQADVRDLGDAASAEYADEIDTAMAQAADLEESLKAASAAPSATTASAVGAEIRAFGGSVRDLSTAVGTTC